jgi:archaemetzincin
MKELDGIKVLGVVNVDLFVPILSYVFGEAQLGKSCAVVSVKRIQYRKDGSKAPFSLYLERAAKLAVHEVAHTFALTHCRETDCIMKYLPDLDTLDAQEIILCRYCTLELSELTKGL